MSGTIGTILLVTSIVHLTAAASWLGTLPALYLAIKRAPANTAQTLAKNYATLGITSVAALILSGAINYGFLIGRPAALITSAYGLTASLKTLLLLALLTFATIEPNPLHPKPSHHNPKPPAQHHLRDRPRPPNPPRRRPHPPTRTTRHGDDGGPVRKQGQGALPPGPPAKARLCNPLIRFWPGGGTR